MHSERAPWYLRLATWGGVIFLHFPLLIIAIYAFNTEDAAFSFPPQGLTLRFRFVAPQVAGAGYGPDKAAADLQALCDGFALAHLPADGPQPAGLVLDLADRVVPFGASDDRAVQFFEAYSIADGACHWELF